MTDLYSNPANASLDDENLQKRRLAYEQETDQQIVAAHQQFTQEINGIDQRGNQFMTQGYAKIEADTDRMLGVLAADFEKYAGQLDPYNPEDIALIVQGANQVASAVNQSRTTPPARGFGWKPRTVSKSRRSKIKRRSYPSPVAGGAAEDRR